MIASQTVQWGDIRVCSITRPFVVFLLLRLDIFFAQFIVASFSDGRARALLLECWQFGCKSPLCKICLLFLLVWPYFLPSSMKNMERGSSRGGGLFSGCVFFGYFTWKPVQMKLSLHVLLLQLTTYIDCNVKNSLFDPKSREIQIAIFLFIWFFHCVIHYCIEWSLE